MVKKTQTPKLIRPTMVVKRSKNGKRNIFTFTLPDGTTQVRKSRFAFFSAMIVDAGEGNIVTAANCKPARFVVAGLSEGPFAKGEAHYRQFKQYHIQVKNPEYYFGKQCHEFIFRNKKALLCITKGALPKPGYPYYYGIRHNDEDWVIPETIEQNVHVNQWGWLLTQTKLQFPKKQNYIQLSNEEQTDFIEIMSHLSE